MKKSLKFISMGILALCFAGCVGFDPDYRKVHFYDNKPYYLPHESRIYHSADMLAKLKYAGINCAANSAVWVADEDDIPPVLTQNIIIKLYNEGKLGCDAPISDQELEYIKHKEILEQEEWQRQQEEWQRQREMMEIRQLERERMDREDERFNKMRFDKMFENRRHGF